MITLQHPSFSEDAVDAHCTLADANVQGPIWFIESLGCIEARSIKQVITLNSDLFGAPGLCKRIFKVIEFAYALTDFIEISHFPNKDKIFDASSLCKRTFKAVVLDYAMADISWEIVPPFRTFTSFKRYLLSAPGSSELSSCRTSYLLVCGGFPFIAAPSLLQSFLDFGSSPSLVIMSAPRIWQMLNSLSALLIEAVGLRKLLSFDSFQQILEKAYTSISNL
ncbi:hypothetical protein J6590_096971 [Homalodisca vitripennis]|nr:hypothetical protein J6590_096971 [Homalodisca vitripennis]